MISATCSEYVYRSTADFLAVRRYGLAASAVRGAVHGGHSWFHHYSILYRNAIFRVQYLARVIYSSVQVGTPVGAYRLLVRYIQSFVVNVIPSYRHIGSFRGMRLNSAIFRYIRTRLYYARHAHRVMRCSTLAPAIAAQKMRPQRMQRVATRTRRIRDETGMLKA